MTTPRRLLSAHAVRLAVRAGATALLATTLALSVSLPAFAARTTTSSTAKIVCIDAGHGGTDSGATYYGLQEKDLTLDIARRLQALLPQAGLTGVLTRDGDQSLSNTQRATICNNAGATTVLSIHLNASSDPKIDYFQDYYGKKIKDGDFTQKISDTYSLTLPNSATALPKHAPTNFASGLLLKTNAPACLAETVFLSNPDEAAALSNFSGDRQQQIAQQLYNGLVAWYAGK